MEQAGPLRASGERVIQEGGPEFQPRSHIWPIPLGGADCGGWLKNTQGAHGLAGHFRRAIAAPVGVRLPLPHCNGNRLLVTFSQLSMPAAAAGGFTWSIES